MSSVSRTPTALNPSSSDSCSGPSSLSNTRKNQILAQPQFLSPLKLRNLIKNAEDTEELLTLLTNQQGLYQGFTMFQSLDHTIRQLEKVVNKTQEDLHEVFKLLEGEGITAALAPLILWKHAQRYHPYRRSNLQSQSPTSPPDTGSQSLSPYSQEGGDPSSFHTAPSTPSPQCTGCGEDGHELNQCKRDYHYNVEEDHFDPLPIK